MSHKYITKMHQENSRGYWLRLPEIVGGVIQPQNRQNKYQKFFRKGKGTWKAALEKALYYRDGYLKEHNAMHFLTTSGTKNNSKPRHNFARNTSSVIGIPLTVNERKYGTDYSWCANYSKDGKQLRRSFSIEHYGYHEAFDMACEVRYEKCGKLIVTDLKAIPHEPKQEYVIR